MQEAIEMAFRNPVIPVLTIHEPDEGVALARALARGGLDVLEVALRTDAALETVGAIVDALPQVLVGAGTVKLPNDFVRAQAAGARFAVSPGVTPALLEAATDAPLPWLPAAATISESLLLLEKGIRYQKFFPAEVLGGVRYLDAILGPVPEVLFCPTGGVNTANVGKYLAQPNVVCVGGSWVAPEELVLVQDWDTVSRLAVKAAALERTWKPERVLAE